MRSLRWPLPPLIVPIQRRDTNRVPLLDLEHQPAALMGADREPPHDRAAVRCQRELVLAGCDPEIDGCRADVATIERDARRRFALDRELAGGDRRCAGWLLPWWQGHPGSLLGR